MKPGSVWYTLFIVRWGNPYVEPPDGRARNLVRVLRPGHNTRIPQVVKNLHSRLGYGSGYFVSIDVIKYPGKKWSDERRYNYRKKMLWNRIQKKYPMFAEVFYQEALQQKPEYYGLTQ